MSQSPSLEQWAVALERHVGVRQDALKAAFNEAPEWRKSTKYPESLVRKDWELSLQHMEKTGEAKVVYAPCDQEKKDLAEARMRNALERAGVTRDLLHCSLSKYDYGAWNMAPDAIKKAQASITEYAQTPAGFLILVGNTGVGKDHIAVGIMRRMIRQRIASRFLTPARIDAMIRATWGRRTGEDAGTVMEKLTSTPFVVCSDLGVTEKTPPLAEFLTRRFEMGLPTVITTNLQTASAKGMPSEATLRGFLGDRLASRLNQARTAVISIDGADYRGSDACRRAYKENALNTFDALRNSCINANEYE